MYRATRQFNEHGYNWYPQIWVEAYRNWFDLEWVKAKHPQGFKCPDEAIRIGAEY